MSLFGWLNFWRKPAPLPPPLPVERPRPRLRRYVYPVPYTSQEELLAPSAKVVEEVARQDGWEVVHKGGPTYIPIDRADDVVDVIRELRRMGVGAFIVDIRRVQS